MAGAWRRQGGFTLVELLIALSVMALVAILSWRGLDGMTRAQAQTRAYTDDVLTLQAGLAQWTADLDAMLDLAELPALDWDGRVLRIVRANSTLGQTGPQIVAWTRRNPGEGGHWMRWQSPVLHSRLELLHAWERAAQWGQSPSTGERQQVVAIVPLVDWRIFYNRSDAWTNPLSSGDTTPPPSSPLTNPNNAAQTPDGVRLVLELPPGGPVTGVLTRDWARPTIGGNKS